MKTSYLILGLWIVSVLAGCDPKQEVIYTGVSNPYFDGTMLDYLRSNEKNWDLTVEMIERADLTDLFEGQVDTLPEITFFAPPSYSILRYLWDNDMESVSELAPEFCRQTILNHVVNGKYLKAEIYGVSGGARIRRRSVAKGTIPRDTEYVDDASLPVGEEIVEMAGKDGLKSEGYLEYFSDGILLRSVLIRRDSYKPQLRVIRRGTAPAVADDGTPPAPADTSPPPASAYTTDFPYTPCPTA